MDRPVLRVTDLRAEFSTPEGTVTAVNGVSFTLRRGSTLAITGESGSGKSTLALCILRLLPHAGRITGGRIELDGIDILSLPPEELRKVRGRQIGIVFQDPSSGLNPVLPAGIQVEETITTHRPVSRREARRQVVQALARMGLPDPEAVAASYPFQLSGGMSQRVMLAIATALNPKVLILDEPTSALDVTVQAAILEDLRQIQSQQGTALLLISHDLGVVAQMADEVAVMYAGSIVEQAPARQLFESPRHPYTASLLASRPRWDQDGPRRLAFIRGSPPSLIDLPEGCPFLPRCNKATTRCRSGPAPALARISEGHLVACYNPMYQRSQDQQVSEM